MAAGQVVEYRAPPAPNGYLPRGAPAMETTIGRSLPRSCRAGSAVVPRPYRDKPAAIFVVLWTAVRLGMAATVRSLVKFDVLQGVGEPRAQTLLGLAMMHAGASTCDLHHARMSWPGKWLDDPAR